MAACLLTACNDDGRELRPATPDQMGSVSTTAAPTTTAPVPGVFDTLPGEASVTLSSPTLVAPFADGGQILPRYTCSGPNESPALSWTGAPPEAVEIAITMTDIDAPGYVHWAMSGIDPLTAGLGEGVLAWQHFPRSRHIRTLLAGVLLRLVWVFHALAGSIVVHRLTRQEAAGTAVAFRDAGGGEEVCDAAFLFRACGIDQPHQQEEGHHGGHKVRVGDFPGAAVVATANHFFDLLDDDWGLVRRGHDLRSILDKELVDAALALTSGVQARLVVSFRVCEIVAI
jgi:hypothetical protein